jgi:predicted regulator of Ras-like GTPase activity (Roadblock/LC7/MglB family)
VPPLLALLSMTKAETAIAELTEISSQIEGAVLVDGKGAVSASTLPDERAASLASSARSVLESAEQVREGELTQVEVASEEGSLFVVRDGARLIAATTGPEPTAGLVFYDLRSALRKATERKAPTKRTKTSGTP